MHKTTYFNLERFLKTYYFTKILINEYIVTNTIHTYIAEVLECLEYMGTNLEPHAALVAIPSVEHSEEHATEACLHDLHAAHLCVSYVLVTDLHRCDGKSQHINTAAYRHSVTP